MIKKIFNFIPYILLLIGLLVVFIDFKIKNDDVKLKLLSINQYNEYQVNANNQYEIVFYSTKKLKDEKYYLYSDSNSLELIVLNINYNEITDYEGLNYYIVSLICKLGTNITLYNASLNIITSEISYTLLIGDILINKINYKKLNYDFLEGHYAYINNNLILVGISIVLKDGIDIFETKLSNNTFIQMQNITLLNDKLDSIITNYQYNIYDKSRGTYKIEPNKKYFLPIGYNKLELLNRINLYINNNSCIELIPFLISQKHLNDFKSFICEAKYA